MIFLEGWLEQITYHSQDTHYTVARMKTGSGQRPITVVGHLASPSAGQAVRLGGRWKTHFRYGEQFQFETAEITRPAGIDGIRQYLQSGVVKGIGPSTAKSIIAAFGDKTIDILDHDPDRLMEVEGIGPARAAAIAEQWQKHVAVSDIMAFLQQHGIKTAYAGKIFKAYGADAVAIMRETPYRLAEEFPGWGFYLADAIARHMDMQPEEPERAAACIMHLLYDAASSGHLFLTESQLIERVEREFEINSATVMDMISELTDAGEMVAETFTEQTDRRLYLKTLYSAEAGIARRLAAAMSVPVSTRIDSIPDLFARIEDRFAVRLSEEQQTTLKSVLTSRIAVITGGPGTGKTTLIQSIATVFAMLGKRVCLAAPTGRAARRLSEVTAKSAHTIHKLLGYHFDTHSFERTPDNPINADVLIVDEASMIDAELMHHLIRATRLDSRVILVGDVFQLPPIGPGNVLADIIESDTVPVHHLTEIFRQAAKSAIVRNAHNIRRGEPPELIPFARQSSDQEFFLVDAPSPEAAASTIVELCTQTLPEVYGLVPGEDIQVLTPIHKGVAGTISLNQKLQRAINANPVRLAGPNFHFRLGDRVMHLKNNYAKDVFNGDIGIVTEIDPTAQALSVEFYGRHVPYDADELDDLTLGYAISVHKSQGSEYPAVVLPMITRHYIMLQRNLLYTAITRAKQLVVIVGSAKAIDIALKNDIPQRRLSGLAGRLQDCLRPQLG